MNTLSEFNEVRFSAYRTAMKLRTVQKRMCRKLKNTRKLVNFNYNIPFLCTIFATGIF